MDSTGVSFRSSYGSLNQHVDGRISVSIVIGTAEWALPFSHLQGHRFHPCLAY